MDLSYRGHFPVTEKWVFLNHAAVAPLSRAAQQKLHAWADDTAANGDVHEGQWWREIESVRARAARLVSAAPGEIAFLKNTSEGIAQVAEGFPWRAGDNIVQPAGEYPANVYPWMHLASRGVELRVVPCRGVRIEPADLEAAMDDRTRLLTVSFVQFATGFRSDLAALGALCRRRGIDFCVDAIQGLGVFPIDVKAMGIDYLAADGHKWLVAPEGAAIFYVSAEKLEKLRPISIGWKSVVNMLDYSHIDYRLKADASRFEGGSFNMPGILALGASLELLETIGIATINARVRAVTDYLVERLPARGATIASLRDESSWSGIVSFRLPHEPDPLALVRRLRQEHIVLSCRDGRLRASPHFYNDKSDIDRLLERLPDPP